MKIAWRGSKADLVARLRELPRTLTGAEPDHSGVVDAAGLRTGGVLLSHIQGAYETKSEGGTDEMGIQWEPLAASTLALRRKVTGAKSLGKLRATLTALPAHRKRLIQVQRNRLLEVYRNDPGSRAQRRQALRFLKLMQPYLTPSRFKKLTSEIKAQKPAKGAALAFSGAFAVILRDTGGLFNSLSPTVTADTVLAAGPGSITVGSNKTTASGHNLLDLHDSAQPRKQKASGGDRLPRRQVLPDAAHPIPPQWWADMVAAYAGGLNQREFWVSYLGNQAS